MTEVRKMQHDGAGGRMMGDTLVMGELGSGKTAAIAAFIVREAVGLRLEILDAETLKDAHAKHGKAMRAVCEAKLEALPVRRA